MGRDFYFSKVKTTLDKTVKEKRISRINNTEILSKRTGSSVSKRRYQKIFKILKLKIQIRILVKVQLKINIYTMYLVSIKNSFL